MRRSALQIGLLLAALALLPGCALPAAHAEPATRAEALGVRAGVQDDAVTRAILAGKAPPRNIFEVRAQLESLGGQLSPHLVANRGHENPESGSFSVFETYVGPMKGGVVKEGELFFGHFTERRGDTLALQAAPGQGALMIELIAWDYNKKLFNFWELIGDGKTGQWRYRGDSADVLADVASLHMGPGQATFGNRLRCSACHTLGGPIMKELDGPHNDWWTDKGKLSLGTMRLAPGQDPSNAAHVTAKLFKNAEDASHLASAVDNGIRKLIDARARRGDVPIRAELRSLFATMEMNLVSDAQPYRERQGGQIALPQAFFVDTRLSGSTAPVRVPQALYARALDRVGSRFAADEAPGLDETRHAFVVPARSRIDNRVIDSLIARGLLDEELVADVLAVDFTTPVYSRARAGLLRYVPARAESASALRHQLVAALKAAPEDAAAQELLRNLTDPARTAAFHRKRAQAYLEACVQGRGSEKAVVDWLRVASQRRVELDQDVTARSPRGKITEPGFRVIFPVDELGAKPGALKLDERDCGCR